MLSNRINEGMVNVTTGAMKKQRVWDGATRSYHWLQLLLCVLLWWSAERELFGVHQAAAYGLLALLGARLLWAWRGSETSQLRHFFFGPSATWQMVKQGQRSIGHNPLSAYMIVALWLLLLLQVGSGLMSSDDVAFEGPLFGLVPDWLQSAAGRWHHLGFDLLLVLVAVHVVAAVVHEAKGEGVIAAMVTGQKQLPEPTRIRFVASWRYWLLVLGFITVIGLWQGSVVWAALLADIGGLSGAL